MGGDEDDEGDGERHGGEEAEDDLRETGIVIVNYPPFHNCIIFGRLTCWCGRWWV